MSVSVSALSVVRMSERMINAGKKACIIVWLVIVGCFFLLPSEPVWRALMARLKDVLKRQAATVLLMAAGRRGAGDSNQLLLVHEEWLDAEGGVQDQIAGWR